MRRGGSEAPSGAGHMSADRADHTGFRGKGLRESAGSAGDMFGGGSSAAILRGERKKVMRSTAKRNNYVQLATSPPNIPYRQGQTK